MVEKGNRWGVCHIIHQYTKANNKYLKDYDIIKEFSYLKHWDGNNLYGWGKFQNLAVSNFKWVENTS